MKYGRGFFIWIGFCLFMALGFDRPVVKSYNQSVKEVQANISGQKQKIEARNKAKKLEKQLAEAKKLEKLAQVKKDNSFVPEKQAYSVSLNPNTSQYVLENRGNKSNQLASTAMTGGVFVLLFYAADKLRRNYLIK
jgi:uncharacterized protein YlaN (UPF0358 family)